MTELRVAGAQMPVTTSVGANLKVINRAIDFALDVKADILLTPEGSLSGYSHRFNKREVHDALEAIIEKVSGRLGLALGTCYIEPDGRCYDEIKFFDREGRYLGFHSKILLCSSVVGPPRGEMEHFASRPLRTFEFEGVTIGGLICNDLWANPCCTSMPDSHLSQKLAKKGARMVFHAVNGDRDASEFSTNVTRHYHEANLRMRAKAGRIWIVTVDNCFPANIPCSSPGGIISPHGDWIVQLARKGEQIFVETIDI